MNDNFTSPLQESPSSQNEQLTYTSQEEPLYVMTVELEKGKSESIKIYSDSKPDELAYDFCKLHNLDFSSLSYLTTQIKKLFESIPPTSPSVLSNSLRPNQECIIEVDEEDNQTSDQRGVNSIKAHSRSNSNNVMYNTDNNLNKEMNKGIINEKINNNEKFSLSEEKSEQQIQDLDDNVSEQSNENIKKESNKQTHSNTNNNNSTYNNVFTWKGQQQSSLFSYQDFYSRFKQNLVEKNQKGLNQYSQFSENTNNNTGNNFYLNNNNNRSKSTYSKRSDNSKSHLKYNLNSKMTIAKNEEMLINFFKNCSKLDEIYQNKINDASLFSKHLSPKEPEIITNEQQSFNSTSKNITNLNTIKENTTGIFYFSNTKSNNTSAQNININNNNNNQYSFYNTSASKLKNPTLSKSLNSFNPSMTRSDNCGVRLYKEGMAIKEKVNNKISSLKQEILSKDESEYTYYPITNHISQRQIRKKMSQNNTNSNSTNTSSNRYSKNNRSSRNKSSDNKKYSSRKYKISNTNSSHTKNKIYNIPLPYSARKKINSQDKKKESNKLSEKELVYKRKKEDTFRKIFNILDSDKDLTINLLTMDTKGIPITIYNIIRPIINEIKYKNQDIKQNEFIDGCMKLFNEISFNDKRALLNFGAKI